MDFSPLIRARKALAEFWEEVAMLKGRCWGPKREDNPYSRSNITLAMRDELVTISQMPDGTLVIHEFVRTKNTELGNRIRGILEKEGLRF